MAKPTFYIIDGHSLIHRAYHSRAPMLRAPDGEPTKATYVFCKILLKLIRSKRPDFLAMTVDSNRMALERRKVAPFYKANRDGERDEKLTRQIKRCHQVAGLLGMPVLKVLGYEADDIIATLVDAVADCDVDVYVVSRDKDLHQLLADNVKLYDPQSEEYFTVDDCRRKWGVGPEQVRDLFALAGDSSDNISGVPGIGPVTAARMLQAYGTLDQLLKNMDRLPYQQAVRIKNNRQALEVSRFLVTLERNVPLDLDVDALAYNGPDWKAARPVFKKLGFRNWSKWA